jgi:hypothetical protein
MKRLLVAICALVFLLPACSGTATPSIPSLAIPSIAVPSVAIPSNLASAAIGQLCDVQSPASLSTIAADLDKVDPNTNTTDIESKLGTLVTALQGAQVTDTTKPARDAAVTAVTQLQTKIKDPATRQDAAKKAAEAIRALSTALCK